jgi:hypothetical protein
MPYCRKCGTKLEEDARFCYVCGTPVAAAPAAAPEPRPRAPRRRPVNMVLVGVLIAVLLLALAFTAIIFLPITPVSYAQTNTMHERNDVNQLNLNLQADTADINIIPQRVNGNLMVLNVTATGSTGIFGSATPVKVTFDNQTLDNAVTVTASVSRVGAYLSPNLHVVCDVYVDPRAALNLTAHTEVGQVNMNAEDQTIQNLNLQSTTGSVEATLGSNVILTGNASATTTTGSVTLNWNQADAQGNITVNVKSTTGTASLLVNRNFMMAGNVSMDAGTTTGSVNFDMTIHDYVGAQIESSKVFGSINVQQDGFSGDQDLLRSDNYPAVSNFNVKLSTTTGSVNIDATSQSLATRT